MFRFIKGGMNIVDLLDILTYFMFRFIKGGMNTVDLLGILPYYIFRFIKGGMNIVDLLGILPYFMSLFLNLVTTTSNTQNKYQVHYLTLFHVYSRVASILALYAFYSILVL